MPKFLVTYHGGGEVPHDPEVMAKIRAAFMQWAQKTGPALADPGAPIASKKTVSSQGVRDGAAEGTFDGWSIVEAADMSEVAQILEDHPFVGRGGSLQINEPVP
jgi:hypothetical protein